MNILLSRHGNTFAPEQKVVWTGGTYDIPLVDKGVEQAITLATSLAKQGIVPNDIFCGSLRRTREYADIIAHELKLTKLPIIDERLNEIDYGDWTGLSSEEVETKYGGTELYRWDSHSEWPMKAHWGGSEQEEIDNISSFVSEVISNYAENDTVLIISSNGKLRYFLKLVPGEFERRVRNQTFKVKTGNICKLVYQEERFILKFWNKSPEKI